LTVAALVWGKVTQGAVAMDGVVPVDNPAHPLASLLGVLEAAGVVGGVLEGLEVVFPA